jgi:hypothetical protein
MDGEKRASVAPAHAVVHSHPCDHDIGTSLCSTTAGHWNRLCLKVTHFCPKLVRNELKWHRRKPHWIK